MAHARREISIGFSEKRFLSGSHICLLYGDEDERLDVLARFFEAGRLDNERMVYVHAGGSEEQARAGLERHGFTASPQLHTRRSEEVYYPHGEFAPDRVLDLTRKFFEHALAEGFSGGRGSGELWCTTASPPPDTGVVLDYEARLTQLLAEYPSTIVCQYDVRRFDGVTVMDILSVHPYTIVRGQLLVNPFYVEPDRFLSVRSGDFGGRTVAGFPSGS
jgi:hypothetical protein